MVLRSEFRLHWLVLVGRSEAGDPGEAREGERRVEGVAVAKREESGVTNPELKEIIFRKGKKKKYQKCQDILYVVGPSSAALMPK